MLRSGFRPMMYVPLPFTLSEPSLLRQILNYPVLLLDGKGAPCTSLDCETCSLRTLGSMMLDGVSAGESAVAGDVGLDVGANGVRHADGRRDWPGVWKVKAPAL